MTKPNINWRMKGLVKELGRGESEYREHEGRMSKIFKEICTLRTLACNMQNVNSMNSMVHKITMLYVC